tara:strand:+ start:1731 stop:1967 length:237 start_codon:yes stop_codon:yes gene_type:complete
MVKSRPRISLGDAGKGDSEGRACESVSGPSDGSGDGHKDETDVAGQMERLEGALDGLPEELRESLVAFFAWQARNGRG